MAFFTGYYYTLWGDRDNGFFTGYSGLWCIRVCFPAVPLIVLFILVKIIIKWYNLIQYFALGDDQD